MRTDTRSQLLKLIRKSGPLTVKQLVQAFGISAQSIHRHLKQLVENGDLVKRGSAPRVFYEVSETTKSIAVINLPENAVSIIERDFFHLSPSGKRSIGIEGFKAWLKATGQEKAATKLATSYVSTRSHYSPGREGIEASDKLANTFEIVYLEKLYYQDFWSIPQFGRTKLGHLVTLGKSGQLMEAIRELAQVIQPTLLEIIRKHEIDAVAFAPHSISRKIVFLKTIEELLDLTLPSVRFVKALTDGVAVAQKSLSKLADRITNARETIFLRDSHLPHKKILLIDDALGSGATLNEMAAKLKAKGVEEVYGYAIVGSLKGFEVIAEV